MPDADGRHLQRLVWQLVRLLGLVLEEIRRSPEAKLVTCLLVDSIGFSSYLLPGLGETFAPAKSSGSASALFSGGGAPARAAKAAPAKAASKKGYDDAVDRVLAKGKKRRRPDDDVLVKTVSPTVTVTVAVTANSAPRIAASVLV